MASIPMEMTVHVEGLEELVDAAEARHARTALIAQIAGTLLAQVASIYLLDPLVVDARLKLARDIVDGAAKL